MPLKLVVTEGLADLHVLPPVSIHLEKRMNGSADLSLMFEYDTSA